MTRELISVGNALDLPGYPVSPAVGAGNLLYTAGVIASSPLTGEIASGDITSQTHLVLDNLQAVLQAAGSTLADLVFVDVLLRDVARDFAAFNEVYAQRIGEPPARRTHGAVLALPELLVEISAVAVRAGRGQAA